MTVKPRRCLCISQIKIKNKTHAPKKPFYSLSSALLCILFIAVCCNPNVTEPSLFSVSAREASAFNVPAENSPEIIPSVQSIDKNISVIPLGTVFGIKLFTDGVIVASLSDVPVSNGFRCPAKESGIKAGDYILSVNGESVSGNALLAEKIGESGGGEIRFEVKREDKVFETTVTPVFSEDSFKTGMWIRDSAAGIGTVTFYNPESGVFAGLGHGICDADTSSIMTLKSGEPAEIALCGIIPGKPHHPGQLQGFFSSETPLGSLLENNETGIYGSLENIPQGELTPVANRGELTKGDCTILSTLDENGPQSFDAKIIEINPLAQNTRNFVVEITDEYLISKTGGIVQGMSGSPILQNGKLVGAVTHVFIENPKLGYGIYAETMLENSIQYADAA